MPRVPGPRCVCSRPLTPSAPAKPPPAACSLHTPVFHRPGSFLKGDGRRVQDSALLQSAGLLPDICSAAPGITDLSRTASAETAE